MGTPTTLVPTNIPDMLEHIKEIESLSDILALIKKIDALKVALEAVDTLHSQSIMYAKLEANALIRVVELGGLNKLRNGHRKTADWLYDLSAQERERYILMCEDGLTIDQVYKREVGDKERLEKRLNEIDGHKELLFDDCEYDGIADLGRFSETVKSKLGKEHAQLCADIVDGARNRLRQMGAVVMCVALALVLCGETHEAQTD